MRYLHALTILSFLNNYVSQPPWPARAPATAPNFPSKGRSRGRARSISGGRDRAFIREAEVLQVTLQEYLKVAPIA